jgi:hypothetical protein
MAERKYKTLAQFYPYYLTEHSNRTCRILHYIGTSLFLLVLVFGIVTQRWSLLWLMPVVGYGFAWVGHFFFEKNRPATFTYPLFSLASDFIMVYHFITGQVDKKLAESHELIKAQS